MTMVEIHQTEDHELVNILDIRCFDWLHTVPVCFLFSSRTTAECWWRQTRSRQQRS